MIFFVTGGSRGIGADIVVRAAEAGHDVAFTYNKRSDAAEAVVKRALEARPDAKCKAYKLDVKDSEQVDAVMDEVLDDFETLDVVVNNAGISRDGLVMSMSNEEWDDVIATNLSGAFYVCRAALPALLANRYGRIINISSVVASGATGQANYAASKAGLVGLTQTLAKEYGRKRITANLITPGFFETEMTKESMPEVVRGFWKQYALVPKGRTGELAELSSIVLFLATKESAFINGQDIRATAGLDWTP